MQAVILAAGEGKRLRPLTDTIPKPLVKVLDKPLIQWVVEALPACVTELVVTTNYKEEMIRAHLGSEFVGRKVGYVHQPTLGGSGEALLLAQKYLSGPFMVLAADDIVGVEGLLELTKHPLALLVAEAEHPERFGVVEVTPNGHIKSIVEKPAVPSTNLVSTASMMLDERIFNFRAPKQSNGEIYLSEMVSKMLEVHPVQAVTADRWIPIGYPADIEKAEALLR